jgi:hypothetical protein
MTSVLEGGRAVPVSESAATNGRLVFTPSAGIQGVLGGGWWPRTHDLSEELPAVLAAVASRYGAVVARISLSATFWDATPEHIGVGDRVVQLAWFRARDAHTVRLLGGGFWHLDLLVIPPDTAADAAAAVLALVASGETVAALHTIATGAADSPRGPLITFVGSRVPTSSG